MKKLIIGHITSVTLLLVFLLVAPTAALAHLALPDLEKDGAIAYLRENFKDAEGKKKLIELDTYNLGATGLRGWIHINYDGVEAADEGLMTASSRQILITLAEAPGNAVLAVNDLILGAVASNSGVVPRFDSDCRKALGVAIGNAEKTGAGTLRVKRWRAGTETDVNIPMIILGNYTATAPYSCPKSKIIFDNARNKFVSQLLTDPQFLSNDWKGAINALAFLASVAPGDANYAAVQTRLQTYARGLTPADLILKGCDTWGWSYICIFLSEYYLRTVADGVPDNSVLVGINKYTVALANGQSKYGTYGHRGAEQVANGSLHGSIAHYGALNAAGTPANIAIIMGKKVLESTGGVVDPEIDPAIKRGSNFLAYYVNKGLIPYGEHEPLTNSHASNGKDPMCAVLFGLQAGRLAETEYFTRMSVAGCTAREAGHTGQGLSYLWGALGANVGGQTAITKFTENFRWHSDLIRRTDGSFTYNGGEGCGGGATADGTYLGATGYNGLSPTACNLLFHAVTLKRLYLTGRNAIAANTLSASKVANAIAAATFKQDVKGYTVPQLMAALGEYDPVVRSHAAKKLATCPLTTEVGTLIAWITNGTMSADPNVRMGACQTLGLLKNSGALIALSQRISDSDLWVRGEAARALKMFQGAAYPQLAPMLAAFTANATDPNVIEWVDPLQMANSYLADVIFRELSGLTATIPKNLLYPALEAGLKQPAGRARSYLGEFIEGKLTLLDIQALAPAIIKAAVERSPADRMYSDGIRSAILKTLAKFKIEEGIPLCLQFKEQSWHSDDEFPFDILRDSYSGAARDALPTLYKWRAHLPSFAQDSSVTVRNRFQTLTSNIHSTIEKIENDGAPPTLTYFKSITATATPPAVVFPATTTTLNITMSDIDRGVQNVIWSKHTGPGAVIFSPTGLTANLSASATFSLPGTYVLRARSVDRSILDDNRWITTTSGFFDFKTYDEVLGAAIKDVTVTVSPDPNRAPVAQNQSLTTALNTDVSVTLGATDADANALDYTVVAAPSNGRLLGEPPNYIFRPTSGYTGQDKFTFKANDRKVDSGVATVTLAIGVAGNRAPVAVNQAVTTLEETAKPITLVGTDADGNPLKFSVVTGPTRGFLSGDAPNLTYHPAGNYPADNFNGSDSFTFIARDASLATSAVATITITIVPVNHAPQATPQTVTAAVGVANPITLSGTDSEIFPLSYGVVAYPTHGILSGSAPNLIYRANANYSGTDSFTFKAIDSEGVPSSNATVSITVVNDAPVAAAQEIKAQMNTGLAEYTGPAVTLTGNDSSNDVLKFSVLARPVNGSLSGYEPYLTYTPRTGFTGDDSFTFKVNDGALDSAPATVSIRVARFQTWTNVAPGNWSAATNWNGGITPAAGGSNTGMMVFNTGTYSGTSANDLSGIFLLNQMNFGSAIPDMTVGGNDLSFVLNTTTPPEINQDSTKAVTISNKLILATGTSVGGVVEGSLTLSGVISGAGSLTQTSSGNLKLTGTNTYSGGTFVDRGTFTLGNQTACGSGAITLTAGSTFQQDIFEGNAASLAVPNALVLRGTGNVVFNMPYAHKDVWLSQVVSGSGGITVQGGNRTLTLTASNTFTGGITLKNFSNRVVISNRRALGAGTFRSEVVSDTLGFLVSASDLTTDGGVTNAFDIASRTCLKVETDGSNHLLLAGPITSADGTGHFHKSGSATLTLSGVNTYGGITTVSGGVLACNSASSLASGPLAITGTAKLGLNFTGARQIRSLSLGGVTQANGTYGSSSSPATYKNDTWFSGTGIVTVAPFAATTTALGLTASGLPSSQGTSLTFTATVTGSTPTGNVSFYNGATLLNTSALNSAFQASFTIILAPSSHKITARYAGDTANEASASAVFTTQPILAPTPPLNLVARSGSNSVLLTWTAVAQATDYQVKRSLTSGGPYTTINVAYSSAFTDNSAVDGTTYYYVVSASNSLGESANSSSVNAKPYTPSSAKNIQTFVFPGLPAMTFSGTDIRVKVTAGTVVTGLSPAYTISPLATGSPVSGAARDFTSPQIYTIKAEDFTTKAYSVTVAVNQPPVAAAQTISLGINTIKPITLTGSDADGDVLDYTIVTSPLNGTLSGTSPNKTYQPNSNYSGADSFTYKANDGMNDSAVVRVDLAVTPLTFTWNSAIAGNWSDGSNWTVGTSPSSVGIESYVLNFNVLGTYTATHNLGAGFLLNRLNFGGSTVVLAGNGLALAANGSNLPQVNQNGASAVTISTNLTLGANTTLGGSGAGALTLSGIISGGGTLIKTTSGNLTLSGVNTYTAGTAVSSGMLTLANRNGLGTGSLTLAAGTTFQQSTFEGNSTDGAVPNALVLSGTGNVIINISFDQKDVWLSRPVSGTAGLTVQGASRSLTLAGNNTFSGGVKLTNANNKILIAHLNALGTGTFRTERLTADSGQIISLADLSDGAGVSNAFDIASGAYLNVLTEGTNHLKLSGSITSGAGIGHLHKSGSATLTLSGANTYTGTTTVAAGTLACNTATALGQGPVAITSGAKLSLNYTGTRQVTSLSLGGVAQANGSYGSTTSLATNKNDTYFTGTGSMMIGPITTNTIVASNLNPAAVGAAVTFTATVSGGSPTGNVSFYNGATLLGSSALNGLFQASMTSSSLAVGTYSITASYAGNSSHASSASSALSQAISLPRYQTWASSGTQGLTVGVNDAPLADPDGDGITNLMEFALGGTPMLSSQTILPKLAKSSSNWLFEYNRSDLSLSPATTQVVEYGSDLTGWTRVIIPITSTGIVEITPGSPSDHVKVTIPNQGPKNFVRLKVSQ